MVNGLHVYRAFIQSTLWYCLTFPHSYKHFYRVGVRPLAQGHLGTWPEDPGIEPVRQPLYPLSLVRTNQDHTLLNWSRITHLGHCVHQSAGSPVPPPVQPLSSVPFTESGLFGGIYELSPHSMSSAAQASSPQYHNHKQSVRRSRKSSDEPIRLFLSSFVSLFNYFGWFGEFPDEFNNFMLCYEGPELGWSFRLWTTSQRPIICWSSTFARCPPTTVASVTTKSVPW